MNDSQGKMWMVIAIILAIALAVLLVMMFSSDGGTMLFGTTHSSQSDDKGGVVTKWDKACCDLGLSCCPTSEEKSEVIFENEGEFELFIEKCSENTDRCYELLEIEE